MSSITVVKNRPEQEDIRTEDGLSVLVHIRSYGDCVPRGTFLTLPDREKYEFCGLDQMLLMVEDIMDSACGAESVSGHRYLCGKPFLFRKEGRSYTGQKSGGAACLSGEKATFAIQVCYRQHRSMQGRLTVQTDRTQENISFRSSLELMRMMHEYLGRETKNQEGRTGS